MSLSVACLPFPLWTDPPNSHITLPLLFPVEFEEELVGITARATVNGVTDLDKAVADFKAHTLRGKAEPGDDAWQVGSCLLGRKGWSSCFHTPLNSFCRPSMLRP